MNAPNPQADAWYPRCAEEYQLEPQPDRLVSLIVALGIVPGMCWLVIVVASAF